MYTCFDKFKKKKCNIHQRTLQCNIFTSQDALKIFDLTIVDISTCTTITFDNKINIQFDEKNRNYLGTVMNSLSFHTSSPSGKLFSTLYRPVRSASSLVSSFGHANCNSCHWYFCSSLTHSITDTTLTTTATNKATE